MIKTPRVEVDVVPEIPVQHAREPWVVDLLLSAPRETWAEMEGGMFVAARANEAFGRRLADHILLYVPRTSKLKHLVIGLVQGLSPGEAAEQALWRQDDAGSQ